MSNQCIISPARITYGGLPEFLQLQADTAHLSNCSITCDCAGLRFVDPIGLCLLGHWFKSLHESGVTIHLDNLPLRIESFLRRMDMFKGLQSVIFQDRTSHHERNDLSGRVIELCALDDMGKINEISSRIAKTISNGIPNIDFSPDLDQMRPSQGERLEESLEYVFSEILMNGLDHGRKRNYGFAYTNIAAQYYPRGDFLDIAIVDNGCGLLETLSVHAEMAGDISDRQAISIARRPRISCNRDVWTGRDTRNQGVGLTISTEMAFQAGGFCGIFSGSSLQRLCADREVIGRDIPYWRGTGVFFRFPKAGLLTMDREKIIAALPDFRTVKSIKFE